MKELHHDTYEFIQSIHFGDPLKSDFGSFPKLSKKEIAENSIQTKNKLLVKKDSKSILQKYPKNNFENAQYEFFSKEVPELKFALNGNYEKAIIECHHPKFGLNEQHLELIISYLFYLQKFDLGLKYKTKYVNKPWSISHLNRVEIIERSKTQKWETIQSSFHEIYPDKNNIWDNFLFAKGFAGLMPYDIYPWTDEWEYH